MARVVHIRRRNGPNLFVGQTKQEGDRQMAPTSSNRFGRRSVLAAAGVAAGSGAITGFPTIWAQNIKNVTLRQFGTGVSNLNAVAEKVKQDLGFTLDMTALDTDAVTQKAVTQPKSYDIADIEYFAIKKVFPTGVMQPMDAKKIKLVDKIVPIFTKGKLTPDSTTAQGTTPYSVGFVDGPERQDLRQGPDRLDDADPDHLQRRHARHPARPGRPADQQLEGPGRSRVQGQGVDPEHPVDRHHGRGDGHGVARHDEIRRQGQHDEARDRQDHRLPDRHQESPASSAPSGKASTRAST